MQAFLCPLRWMEQKTGLHFQLIQDNAKQKRKERGYPEIVVSPLVSEQEGFHLG